MSIHGQYTGVSFPAGWTNYIADINRAELARIRRQRRARLVRRMLVMALWAAVVGLGMWAGLR